MAGYQLKTGPGETDIAGFLAALEPAARAAEAQRLHAIFARVTGYPARIWGGRMVGYGRYAYRYASGHAGESLATGFAPGKTEISVYILPGCADHGAILADLGPHRLGKSCLYIRRLDRIDDSVLARLIRAGLDDLARHWPIHPV